MHLASSSLYLPVTPVTNASTTQSAGIGQVPALAPPLFFTWSSAAARKSNSISGERVLGFWVAKLRDGVYATMCGAKHVRVAECFDTAIPVIIKKKSMSAAKAQRATGTYMQVPKVPTYQFDRVPVQTRVISRFARI